MLKAFFILLIITILSWIATYYQEKYKKIALVFTFLGIFSIFLGTIEFFTNVSPLENIKSIVISKFHDDSKSKNEEIETDNISYSEDASPIQVKIPEEVNASEQESENDENGNNLSYEYTNAVVILNVEENMYRDEMGVIHIIWTPIFNQSSYKLKVEIDDPFSNIENQQEYVCENNYYDLNLSECSSDTVVFLAIAIFDDNISDWVYSEKISFTLY